MAFRLADRVKETTQTTGTSALTLAGSVKGFQAFSDALADNDVTTYAIVDRARGDHEVGVGTYSGGTLTRDSVLYSSNGDAKVSFGSGQKIVGITHSGAQQPGHLRAGYYGASPNASGSTNTTAIQNALDEAKRQGGAEVAILTPGTYELDEAGANPYQAGHRHCLDIDGDDTTLRLGEGVTLKLADDQQTDANGPVDVIVGRDVSGVSIVGAGPGASRITGNTAGQTSWTGGYSQVDQGTPWRFYATAAGGLSNVKVEGLQVDDFFGTSGVVGTVIGGADSDIPNSEVVYRDIFSFDCGEGPLVTRTDGVTWENVSVEERSSVSAGDGAEVALSNNVTITNLRVKVNGGASVATAFDLFGCKRVTVTNFIFDGWNSGFSLGTTSNGTNCDDVVISNGVAHGLTTASGVVSAASDVGFFQVTNVEIADTSNLGLQLNMDPTAGPALFMNCRWINATAARCLQGTNAIFIGCEFSEQVNGIDIVHSTADTPDVRLVNCVFRNNTDAIEVNGNGNAFSPTGAIINPTLSGNTNVLNARQSGTFDSMDMKGLNLSDTSRPAAGIAGRQIFNTDDGNLNIDTGSGWILPDGTSATT